MAKDGKRLLRIEVGTKQRDIGYYATNLLCRSPLTPGIAIGTAYMIPYMKDSIRYDGDDMERNGMER